MTLGATLYLNNSHDAVAFYCDAFNLELGYNVKNDDGTYLHAELTKNRTCIFAISESKDIIIRQAMIGAKQPTVSIGINLENDEELNYAYETLSHEGNILRPIGSLPWSPCSADLVDKFGVCWYIYVTQHKPE